jgi:opacity protein-like surface antigen
MIKKIIFAVCSLSFSAGIAFASPAPYLGAGLGIVGNTSNVKINGTSFSGGSYRGVPINVFAGYGGPVNQSLYFAGEVFATLTTMNLSDNNSMKTTYSYGISALPGVMLSDYTIAFLRVGVLQSRFSEGDAETTTGGQVGFGLKTSLTQNVDLRGEYDYVAYRSKNVTGGSISPRSDQTSISLIYNFD